MYCHYIVLFAGTKETGQMIIDVNDPSLNQILNICFYLILAFGLVSLIPWKLKYGKNRWTMALPLLAIVVYIKYEHTIPNNWDILMDLVLLWPVLMLTLLLGLIRGILIWRHRAISRRDQM
jgi:hypothetical protein